VYNAVSSADTERIAIAKFWDCNPNISVTQGHVMYFQQKISPGGHWLNIAATVCKKENLDGIKTAEILSKIALTMADSFINCWEAKFHYNAIRPETVINKYIDKDWKPLLQTPPFPEYPSGHSVVSGASSVILTHYFGENYAYTDSTELPFGIPSRNFRSFKEAANEASVSRLYGGIHYLPALNNGLEEGREIAGYILEKLK
jgi:membrane-associated phospholipid phosphatase